MAGQDIGGYVTRNLRSATIGALQTHSDRVRDGGTLNPADTDGWSRESAAEASHMKYTVVVNGEPRTVDVPERMPLLWVLRDAMGLKGTKFGCGMAQCGACTVLLDGQPTRSCTTAISTIGTRAVSTIESLPRDGSHPLQRAWMELDVPQCGYCQAGQLMAASALLKATPNPTDAQIDTAMSGNVCRCGTYIRIREAIKAAASAGRRA